MIRKRIETLVIEALESQGIEVDKIKIERPTTFTHGDYTTNVALIYSKKMGISPRELAGKLTEELMRVPAQEIEKIEIAGPGFLNFFLSPAALEQEIFQEKEIEPVRKGENINIEFISTNPTGELHIGHARSAFYGDALARVLVLAGAKVTREFYINDSRDSNQINELGKTALGLGEQYKTPELEEKMRALDVQGSSPKEAGVKLAGLVQASNHTFIENNLGIHFDVWYSEDAEIRATGVNEKMLALLKERGVTYEKEGALWLKTTEYGDDEDRVVVRSDGTMTYFVADISYHQKKFDRRFTTVIDIWGSDHHGHIKRMHATGKILGWPTSPHENTLQPIVFCAQMVSLKEDGGSKKMSKRAGNVILLRDLVEEFGIDTVRWFFNEKALSTQMTFDMALAREQSEKNPVYYVQYAHARIASIEEKICGLTPHTGTAFTKLMEVPSARALASRIVEFSEVIADIAHTYNVNALTVYATELASASNAFYRDVRIIENEHYDEGALTLARSAKEAIRKTLSVLGISAPEKM